MPSYNILLVEDEDNVAAMLKLNLEAEGYGVVHAPNLAAARTLMAEDISLIVLDVMLPDGNGMDFADELRQQSLRLPILMLTAKDTTGDIVEGLESGADDYLCKPFQLDELLGRIFALLRRQDWDKRQVELEHISFYGIDIDMRSGLISGSSQAAALTDIELKLLRYFSQRPYEELKRDDIMQAVWDAPSTVKSRTLDNFVLRLRKLFEPDVGNPQHFLTVYGSGYRYVPPPSEE